MVDQYLFMEWQANKDSVRFPIQPKIFFSAKLATADFRIFDCFEQLRSSDIALFGLFGFFTQKLFEQKIAALACISISFPDELFQHFLVDRVGDWRDVWLNLFSASLGMFIAFILSGADCNRTEKD